MTGFLRISKSDVPIAAHRFFVFYHSYKKRRSVTFFDRSPFCIAALCRLKCEDWGTGGESGCYLRRRTERTALFEFDFIALGLDARAFLG